MTCLPPFRTKRERMGHPPREWRQHKSNRGERVGHPPGQPHSAGAHAGGDEAGVTKFVLPTLSHKNAKGWATRRGIFGERSVRWFKGITSTTDARLRSGASSGWDTKTSAVFGHQWGARDAGVIVAWKRYKKLWRRAKNLGAIVLGFDFALVPPIKKQGATTRHSHPFEAH